MLNGASAMRILIEFFTFSTYFILADLWLPDCLTRRPRATPVSENACNWKWLFRDSFLDAREFHRRCIFPIGAGPQKKAGFGAGPAAAAAPREAARLHLCR